MRVDRCRGGTVGAESGGVGGGLVGLGGVCSLMWRCRNAT